ncbi:Major facilitator superfamily domain general substrate transporter [Penicillium robsamsonii]|uniref:Major facilitator superfamily domain general substrate transporter n=1 Tax=Penicillium robsamsonii TaxID=1792511 RepID=UPI002547AA78|nr:Major facilitator superfamily domain general substrate transporter [Penicillium robsamsonii]KAJ5817444.1 Major facilitator superfamily domain general substrate transporter [Penicillium robsamsonii]
MGLPGTRLGAFRAYFFGYFVCTAGFLFGYDTGIVGGILEFKSYVDDFGYTDQTTVSAVMVSLQNVGAFLSALGIFWVSERYGRKKTVQAAMTVFCLGVILQVVPSHSLVCFYIGRFVAGLGLGAGTAVVPAYNAEMAPKEIRGKLGSGMQWLFALGVMLSYWIDYAVKLTLPVSSKQWQIPVGLQMVPAGVLALGLCAMPESVRWLAKKGRFDEAWESLAWMRASEGLEVKAEFNEIRVGLEEERRATEGFNKRELLEPANRYRLLLAVFMFCGQQCTGMTALAYFGPQFFKLLVGNNTNQSLLITGLFGAEKFVTVGIYILFFSEMWGRKPTLWISALLMAGCFIIVTVVKETTPEPDAKATSAGIGMVAMIFLTNSIYQFSWGPLPWPYTAEIFPTRIREIGTSVAVSTQWLFNFLFSLVTRYMMNSWGSYVFLFYAILDIIMAIIVFFFVKETKGKSLEEMETIFHSKAAFDVDAVRRDAFKDVAAEQVNFRCHLCGVSFNIIFRLQSGELDVPGPDWVQKQCDETDDDSKDDEYTAQDLDYQSLKDYEDDEPYEYDSDYESDDMSLGREDMPDKEHSEDSSSDANDDPEGQMYYNWVLQTFNPWSATMRESQMPVGYFDTPMSGYSADAISPEEARGCRTAQFLVHKTTQRDLWKADQLHEPWEINGDWSLSGICDGTPSRDSSDPTVWPARNGIQIVEADNVKFSYQEGIEADDIAMPFHPWCFDIFCRQSKVQFQRVNAAGLMTWRNAEFEWDAFRSFPRAKEVRSAWDQWWAHETGSEYLVANPLYVPGLPELLLAAVKNEGSPSSSDSCHEIKSSQPVTNLPSASHHSPADFLSSLPSEIQLMIIGYLDSKDVISLGLTSRAFTQLPNCVWYGLVRKEMPWLWEAWEESECIHNPSPWTILTTADIKCVLTARSEYARALVDDSYTQLAAEKAAEHRFALSTTIPDQVKLPRVNTDWRRVFMQIQLNWHELKGLRNRQRIWVDVEEAVRRICKFDP